MTNNEETYKIRFKDRIYWKFCNSILKMPFLAVRLRKYGAKYWASRKYSDKRGVQEFIKLAPTSYPLIEEVKRRSTKKSKILDLCSSAGRHMNALYKDGYKQLIGIEINKNAEEIMKKEFPKIANDKNVKKIWAGVEEALPRMRNNSVEVTFTHGKTIEHITPRFNLAKHMCRITSKYIVLANVGLHNGSYPRFWIYEFEKYGFALVKLLQPEKEWSPKSETNKPHSLVVLRKIKQ